MISTANTCWNSKNTEKSLLGIYIRQRKETDLWEEGWEMGVKKEIWSGLRYYVMVSVTQYWDISNVLS